MLIFQSVFQCIYQYFAAYNIILYGYVLSYAKLPVKREKTVDLVSAVSAVQHSSSTVAVPDSITESGLSIVFLLVVNGNNLLLVILIYSTGYLKLELLSVVAVSADFH